MNPLRDKRLQLYLRYPAGLLVVGLEPGRYWILVAAKRRTDTGAISKPIAGADNP